MAENCTKSATFTLPEGKATDSNGSLQLPDDNQGIQNVDQGTRNVDQGTRNVVQGTWNVDQGTRNVDQGTQNVTQTPSEVVDVDSERLQNRYVQTESHLLQSTANDIGWLINLPVKLHKL